MPSSDPTRVNPDVVKRTLDRFDAARRSERHHARLPISELVVRDSGETGDGSYTITGHAATTESEYTLYENDFIRVRERISATAFDDVLAGNPDVHLNINHDMRYAMARTGVTGVGSLELSMDSRGLRTFARVSPNITFVRDLSEQMRLGIIDQMSFAFTIADERRSEVDDGERVEVLYDITKVRQLYDVCVCAQGANPQTDASLRSLSAVLGRDDESSGLDHRSTVEGDRELLIATHDVSGGEVSTRVLIAKAQAQARSKRSHFPTKDPTHAQEA